MGAYFAKFGLTPAKTGLLGEGNRLANELLVHAAQQLCKALSVSSAGGGKAPDKAKAEGTVLERGSFKTQLRFPKPKFQSAAFHVNLVAMFSY